MSKDDLEPVQSYSEAEDVEGETLVPHRQTLFGLKVVDAEEAATVRRVGGAVLGLMALLCLHFLIHVHHHGDVLHAVGHLLVVLVLPAAGYIAVSQRSKRAAWAFHMLIVVSSAFHARALASIVPHLLHLETWGGGTDCSDFASDCTGLNAELARNSFNPDHSVWRCHGGRCIKGTAYCDHKVNCFDGSDERPCVTDSGTGGTPWALDDTQEWAERMNRCKALAWKQKKAPTLRYWWILMSVPMWVLCVYAAYHSLEFYVQLRVRNLAARVDGSEATIFERDDDDKRSEGL